MIKIPGYNGICKQGHFNQRFHGGVALYTHSSCPSEQLHIQSNLQVVATRIQLHNSLFLTTASLYLPCRNQISYNEIADLINQLTPPFILLGDFNSHNILWGNRNTDNRGRIIESILQNMQLVCLNDGSPTHESGTAIDLSIATSALTPDLNWTTIPTVLCSDHHPIIIDIQSQRMQQEFIPDKLNYKKTDWDNYNQDPSWLNLQNENEFTSSEDMIDYLYTLFNNASDKHIPKYTPKNYFPRTFWNETCKGMWKERERLYRKYKRTQIDADKIHWKHQRAQTKQYFKQCQKQAMQKYLEDMKHSIPISQIYQKLRQLRGRPPKSISPLNHQNSKISKPKDIANIIAQSFAANSSNQNCSPTFYRIKQTEESKPLDFSTNTSEPYNQSFTMIELKTALSSTKNTSPGPDQVHYQMIRHLPENALDFLLSTYNRLWVESYYPPQWNKAIIIPIPKPGKDPTNATNYRPIALTSCLGKVCEKMINKRLLEYLENNKLLTPTQCGFRKYHSTIDHLIRLDTYIRKAFTENKVTVGVFFDLAKAYDTTWRHGILSNMYDMGVRGRMAEYIVKFLGERKFRVVVNNSQSEEHVQESGVPQGSILSVTLFAIKINSLASVIPPEIHKSLFVDDLQIAYSGHNMQQVLTTLQPTINKIANWADENGFTFSSSKTHCITFHSKPDFPLIPTLKMKGLPLGVEKCVKFLGLHWDSQLTWSIHINKLIASCNTSLNLLKTLSSRNWGADQHIMLQTYRLIIRPKIDYGCLAYGSASEALLRKLDAVHNEALRLCSGAFKSSPIESLYILMNEPSLTDRRKDLMCRKFFQIKCHSQNPAYNHIINANLLRQFSNSHLRQKPLIQRVSDVISDLNIETRPVLPYKTPTLFSWCLRRPIVDVELATPLVKTIPNFYPHFREHVDTNYPLHTHIYTDGSKDEHGVGAAAVYGPTSSSASLPRVASVYTAELKALILACTLIREDTKCKDTTNYLICSDSLSAAQGLNNMEPRNQLMYRLQIEIHMLLIMGYKITILWIPGHKMIPGNDLADEAAKAATSRHPEFISCPHTDWFPEINTKIRGNWTERWQNLNSKLKAITEKPTNWNKLKITRKEEVVLSRLRIGHTNLTHSHLMDDNTRLLPPTCPSCNNQDVLSIEHIFLQCPSIDQQRALFKSNLNVDMTIS